MRSKILLHWHLGSPKTLNTSAQANLLIKSKGRQASIMAATVTLELLCNEKISSLTELDVVELVLCT